MGMHFEPLFVNPKSRSLQSWPSSKRGYDLAAPVPSQVTAMQLPRPALQPTSTAGTAAPPMGSPKTAPADEKQAEASILHLQRARESMDETMTAYEAGDILTTGRSG